MKLCVNLNGHGYFYVRLYFTSSGSGANVVEEYVMLSIMLYVIVGLKRSWDKKKIIKTSGLCESMKLCVIGVILLTFMN
eukprot:12423794-Karenia_brevis.AAC.1